MKIFDLIAADIERLYYFTGRKLTKKTYFFLLKEALSPRGLPVLLVRFTLVSYSKGFKRLSKFFSFVNFFIFGLEIASQCEIGPGLFLPHTQGTVIGAKKIGNNVTIFQNVTLGAKEVDLDFSSAQRPVIGNNVVIGSGAKVLGNILLDDNVKVGANAVVLDSFPANVIIAGIPAKILNY